MVGLSIAIVAFFLELATCRHLSNMDMDNEISMNGNALGATVFARRRDWVRISEAPTTVVSRPIGSRIELECEAMGSPAPVIQWLKGNEPLTERESFETNIIDDTPSHGMAKTRSRLVIPAALPGYEDIYTCVAEAGSEITTSKIKLNLVGNGLSGKNLSHLFKEMIPYGESAMLPRIVYFDTIYMDVIGRDIALPCRAIGTPPVNIMWFDSSEKPVTEASTSRISVLPDGELRIRGILWEDMGLYTCIARNDLGQDSITTFVYPMLDDK